jgi:hypothetical protein
MMSKNVVFAIKSLKRRRIILYIEYQSVCPFVRIGSNPPPLPESDCALPPGTKGGGGGETFACRWGARGS